MQNWSGNNFKSLIVLCNSQNTDRFVECFWLCAETFGLFNKVVKFLAALQDGFDCVVLAAKPQK